MRASPIARNFFLVLISTFLVHSPSFSVNIAHTIITVSTHRASAVEVSGLLGKRRRRTDLGTSDIHQYLTTDSV